MKKPSAKEIREAIDNMSSLCEQGKKDVKKLVKTLGFEVGEPEYVPKCGEVWEDFEGNHFLITDLYTCRGGAGVVCISSALPYAEGLTMETLGSLGHSKRVAKSLKDYWARKSLGGSKWPSI